MTSPLRELAAGYGCSIHAGRCAPLGQPPPHGGATGPGPQDQTMPARRIRFTDQSIASLLLYANLRRSRWEP